MGDVLRSIYLFVNGRPIPNQIAVNVPGITNKCMFTFSQEKQISWLNVNIYIYMLPQKGGIQTMRRLPW